MFFVKPWRVIGEVGLIRSGCLGQGWCGPGGLVGLAGAEHGEDDVAAAAGQADQGGVVTLAFGALAVVERLGGRVAQRCERGQEHGVLSRWLPRRLRVSPARLVPDWRVTGARPA